MLCARPAVTLWSVTACPCLLHSPGSLGSHANRAAPLRLVQRVDTHTRTHHTLLCQPFSLPVPAEKQFGGLRLKALNGPALGNPCLLPILSDLNMGPGHEGPGVSKARAVPGLRHVQSGAARKAATNTHGCEHTPLAQHCAHPCARGTHEQTLSSPSLLVPSAPRDQGEGLTGGSPEPGG